MVKWCNRIFSDQCTSYVSPLHLIEDKGMYTIYYSTIVDYHLEGWETQGVGHCPEDRPYQGVAGYVFSYKIRKTMRFI